MIQPQVLDALLAAGCTAEQIVAAVKADIEAALADAPSDERTRNAAAQRQRRYRERRRATTDDAILTPHSEERSSERVSKDAPARAVSTQRDGNAEPFGPSLETPVSPAPWDEGCDAGDAVTHNVTGDVTEGVTRDVTQAGALVSLPPTPPNPSFPPPKDPLKGVQKVPPAEPVSFVSKADCDAVWDSWPRLGRARSSRAKANAALRTAAKAHGLDAVRAGVAAFLASPDARKNDGEFVPALHRWLRDERFLEWAKSPLGYSLQEEEAARLECFLDDGFWSPSWAERPDDPHSKQHAEWKRRVADNNPHPEEPRSGVSKDAPERWRSCSATGAPSLLDHPSRRALTGAPQDEGVGSGRAEGVRPAPNRTVRSRR